MCYLYPSLPRIVPTITFWPLIPTNLTGDLLILNCKIWLWHFATPWSTEANWYKQICKKKSTKCSLFSIQEYFQWIKKIISLNLSWTELEEPCSRLPSCAAPWHPTFYFFQSLLNKMLSFQANDIYFSSFSLCPRKCCLFKPMISIFHVFQYNVVLSSQWHLFFLFFSLCSRKCHVSMTEVVGSLGSLFLCFWSLGLFTYCNMMSQGMEATKVMAYLFREHSAML